MVTDESTLDDLVKAAANALQRRITLLVIVIGIFFVGIMSLMGFMIRSVYRHDPSKPELLILIPIPLLSLLFTGVIVALVVRGGRVNRSMVLTLQRLNHKLRLWFAQKSTKSDSLDVAEIIASFSRARDWTTMSAPAFAVLAVVGANCVELGPHLFVIVLAFVSGISTLATYIVLVKPSNVELLVETVLDSLEGAPLGPAGIPSFPGHIDQLQALVFAATSDVERRLIDDIDESTAPTEAPTSR